MSSQKKEMFDALHPDPDKQGTRVTKSTYDAYRAAVLAVVPATAEGTPFSGLAQEVEPHISEELRTSTSPIWWVMTVILDLEARNLLERIKVKGKRYVRRV